MGDWKGSRASTVSFLSSFISISCVSDKPHLIVVDLAHIPIDHIFMPYRLDET